MSTPLQPEWFLPSFRTGFARSAAESAYPHLWHKLQVALAPALGRQGGPLLRDWSGHGHHGTITQGTWGDSKGSYLELASLSPPGSVVIGKTANVMPTGDATFILAYEKSDSNLRQRAAFGSTDSGLSFAAVGAHIPWDDGVVYFDYGLNSGNNRVTASGLTFGNDVWGFRAGSKGIEIHQNGIRRAAKTVAITRSNSTNSDCGLGFYAFNQNDIAKYRVFLIYHRWLSDGEMAILSRDPLALFRPRRPTTIVAGTGSGADLEQEISQTLNLLETLGLNYAKNFSLSDTLTLVDSGGFVQGYAVSNDLGLTDTAEQLLFPGNVHNVADNLGLTDEALGDNASVEDGGNDLNLTQTVSVLGPIYVSVNTTLALSHSGQGSLGVPWEPIAVEHSLGLNQTLNRAREFSVTDTLSLTDEAFTRQEIEQTLSLSQSASAGYGEDVPEHELDLTHTVVVNGNFVRTLSHSNILRQSLTYFIDGPCAHKQYNRFVGEGDGAAIPARPLMFNSDFVLESLSGTKQIVRLRSPEMDDRDRLGFNRINRETRGGELNVYSDPNWPKINTLLVTIVALKQTKVEELQSFMLSTLGQQIKLQDWKGRCWSGVITTPGDVATEDGRDAWTISFEFEGEPYDGQAIDDRISFDQDVLVIGPVEEDADPSALALDQYVTAVVESP